jgi:anti-anti-sigma factor
MTSRWTIQPPEGGRRRVVVSGHFDFASEHDFVAAVDETLVGDDAAEVLLDFAAVDFMDSSGVRALMQLRERHGEQVRLAAASAAVTRVLDIAGVTDALIHPTGAAS